MSSTASPLGELRGIDRFLSGAALLAPVALLFPWTVAPSGLGLGLGGPRFFLHWLTKYPNVGPINGEVLLGILCILGAAIVPASLGAWRLLGGRRRGVAFALVVAACLAYLSVLVRLDVALFLVGVVGAPVFGASDHVALPVAVVGPTIRLLALLCCVGIASRLASARHSLVSPPGPPAAPQARARRATSAPPSPSPPA